MRFQLAVRFVVITMFVLMPATGAEAQALISVQSIDGNAAHPDSVDRALFTVGETWAGIKVQDDVLYVAVRSEPLHVASVCILTDSGVGILHASAALGSISYSQDDESWLRQSEFNWEMRSARMDDESIAERSAYFALNGWLASTVDMGDPGETEFIVDTDQTGAIRRIAVGLMTVANPDSILVFPSEAAACGTTDLVGGSSEIDTLEFATVAWYSVE